MKYYVLLGFVTVAAVLLPRYASAMVLHREADQHQGAIGESEHHHHVEHEFAKSHQSIKFEHFHPVPVFVKKDHSHLLHHPLEKGKSEQKLKQVHPETEHSHGHGLVLEDHRLDTESFAHSLGHEIGHEQGGHEGGHEQIQHGGYEHFEGGFGGTESITGYADVGHEDLGHYTEDGNSAEEYKYEHY